MGAEWGWGSHQDLQTWDQKYTKIHSFHKDCSLQKKRRPYLKGPRADRFLCQCFKCPLAKEVSFGQRVWGILAWLGNSLTRVLKPRSSLCTVNLIEQEEFHVLWFHLLIWISPISVPTSPHSFNCECMMHTWLLALCLLAFSLSSTKAPGVAVRPAFLIVSHYFFKFISSPLIFLILFLLAT